MIKLILLILFGLIVMLSGCVPFGMAIYNNVNSHKIFSESINLGNLDKVYQSSLINVNTENLILPTLQIHLTTSEIAKNNNTNYGDEYEAKYRFPITVIITDNKTNKLYDYNGKLQWNSGNKSYELNNVTSRSGEVIVEIDLDKVAIPAPGEIKVSVTFSKDQFYYANLLSAELIIYDNVQTHTRNIIAGIVIIIIGAIIFIIGVIVLILKQINSQTHLSKKTMNNDTNENLNPNLDEKKNRSSINSTAMLCHLSTFAGFIIPFGGILGPLILWQIKKDEDPFINRHGISAMNFHLSMMIYYFIGFLLTFVVIGFFILPILAITELILVIIASIKASNGEEYQYPLSFKFIKVID